MSRHLQGLKAWLVQRLSGAYIAVFMIYFALHLMMAPPLSYADWHDWMLGPVMGIALAIFFAAMLMHAWIGMRDILIDYVHCTIARLTLMSLVALGLMAVGLWVLRILFGSA